MPLLPARITLDRRAMLAEYMKDKTIPLLVGVSHLRQINNDKIEAVLSLDQTHLKAEVYRIF